MMILSPVIHRGHFAGLKRLVRDWLRKTRRERRRVDRTQRYLRSEAWRQKQALVLERDNHKCVYCGEHATEVHHRRYSPERIDREPAEWLVSVCTSCSENQNAKWHLAQRITHSVIYN